MTLGTLALRESDAPAFNGGHALCGGCGIPMVVSAVRDGIDTPVVVVTSTGCLEVASARYPHSAWNVPWLHVAFENGVATVSDIEAAYRALRRRDALPVDTPVTFVVFAGGGATHDFGLQAQSGALERGHRFVYVCYDDEACMNTVNPRSSATPSGADTTTEPAGATDSGNHGRRKDITAAAVAHHIPYVAQASISHWHDLSDKATRAARADGPAFLNVMSTCQLGWRHSPRLALRVAWLAVQTRYWPLYEVVRGYYRLTDPPRVREPIEAWLETQGRFRHLFAPEHSSTITEIQQRVDAQWEALLARCRADAWAFESDGSLRAEAL